MNEILVIGHRGVTGSEKENTLDAFLHAIDQGCSALEMDLRFDHFRRHFYFQHDFLHQKKFYNNTIEKVIPKIPKNIFLFIEFKTFSVMTGSFVKRFKNIYNDLFDNREIVVFSYNPFVIMKLKKIIPDIQRGYLCGNPISYMLFKSIFRKLLDPEYFFIHRRMIRKKIIDSVISSKLNPIAYVLNMKPHWRKAIQYGVKGIITDYPKNLTKYLKRGK